VVGFVTEEKKLTDSGLTVEEKREFLVKELVALWNDEAASAGTKIFGVVTEAMEFVTHYEDFSGADKKVEVLAIVEEFLSQTDQPGPDFVVDKAIMWAAEAAIDYLYDAFKGKFNFDTPK
jgi:hypothetical protein